MGFALGALVAILLADAASPTDKAVAPADLPVTIVWSAPAECPGEQVVRDEIRGRLSAHVKPVAPIDVRAVIAVASGGRYRLHLQTRVESRDGERTIVYEDCKQIAQAAGLMIALLIDPNARVAPDASITPVLPPVPPAPSPATVVSQVPSPPVPWFRRTSVGVDGEIGYGRLPGLALGTHARVGREGERMRAELRFGAWLPKDKAAVQLDGAGGQFWMADAGAAGCLHSSTMQSLGVQSCLGARAARLSGTSYGVSDRGSTSAWLFSVYATAGICARLSEHLRTSLTIEGGLQPSRPSFAVGGIGRVYRPPVVSASSSLGFEVIF